ncbi:N-(5'-phosphoribosyl)anthranilate isomerase [Marivirga lumbricoides]|uniref:N-(5'-phosphoribosyl)anthranilate isomerase n=1 Tax=Marivirga lumbricoides TaxID=1046115 RepID=A0A2T4DVJ0_9BACT|nr:N-(5'-phosphoribosyl)anthranilate isomerase [Marivirga lumbricoides]
MQPAKLKIKICGMRDFENVQNVLKHKPDYMGFIFYDKSKRYVNEEQVENLLKLNFGTTKRVGVFVNQSPEIIIDFFQRGYFDLVQLHGEESPEDILKLKYEGIEIIKVFSVGEDFNPSILAAYEPIADYFLFDTKGAEKGGNGYKFDWNILHQIDSQKPFFLSGGLQTSDLKVVQNMELKNLMALDYNSKIELLPGLKDLDEVEKILNN